MSRPLRIAIDGPSGSGKSTLGKALAIELGLPYVDTGAMYRAVVWAAQRADLQDDDEIVALLETLELEVAADPAAFRIRVNGTEVTGKIRSPEVSKAAAQVAAIEGVRRWMVPRQRQAAAAGGVLEGRDIGTVVLPDADYKFYVTSDERTRIGRRAAQLGLDENGAAVVADVRERDELDRTRRHSPLRTAADAIVIDTTGKSIDDSLAAMLESITTR